MAKLDNNTMKIIIRKKKDPQTAKMTEALGYRAFLEKLHQNDTKQYEVVC